MEYKRKRAQHAERIVYKVPDSQNPEEIIEPKESGKERLRAASIQWLSPERVGLIFGLLAALLVLIGLVTYFISQIGTYKITQNIYRYDTSLQIAHEGTTQLRRRDNVLYLKNGGAVTEVPQTPIYFTEAPNQMLVPNLMMIAQPGKDVPPVRTPYYTTLEFEGSDIRLSSKGKPLATVTDGFLFDGGNIYVFLEDMTVQYMGQTVEMPAMSYAIVLYDTRMELYPYEGIPVIQQTGSAIVTAQNKRGTYQLDLSRDIMTAQEGEFLLFSDTALLNELKAGWPGTS